MSRESNKVPGIWKWTVAILFLLNIALLATIWFKPSGEKVREMHEGERPNEFIQRNLHFSREQLKVFDILRERHHDSVVILQREGEQLRRQYFENLQHPESADSTRLQVLSSAIGRNQQEIEIVTYRHFRQVRALCDDKQKLVFDNIITEVLKRMSGHHGPPPRDDAGDGRRQGPPPAEQ